MPITIRSSINYQISSTATVNEGVTTSTAVYTWNTAGVYSFVATPGTYDIKLWGGGGGGSAGTASPSVQSITGAGAGGLATNITIENTELWSVFVAQGGRSATGNGSIGTAVAGVGGTGYGQGGNGAGGGNAWGGGGGGGSSAVVTTSFGPFVAGGGGGAGSQGSTALPTGGNTGTSAGGLLGAGGSSGQSGIDFGGGGGGSSLTGIGGPQYGRGGSGGMNFGQPQSIGDVAQRGQDGVVGIATRFPGNFSDADYVAGVGIGGAGATNAGDGRILIRQTVLRGTYTFNISAPTVVDGTILYWTNAGTTTAQDFVELANEGALVINNQTGTVTLNILGDALKEGSETIIFQLREVSTTGPVVATRTVTINDAVTIDPILNTVNSLGVSIVPGSTEVTETGRLDFFVYTQQIADGTTLYWNVSGNITLLDFFQQVTTGTMVINQGAAVVRLNVYPDIFTEGDEFLIFQVRLNNNNGPVLAQSDRIIIKDTSTFPPVSASLYSFSSFTFTTAGLTGPNGPSRAQCLASYNTVLDPWLNNTSYFDVSPQGYQRWTCPQTGPYRIIAIGAPGGPVGGGNRGAQIQGEFLLESGQIIRMVVGQYGGGANSGGGGTFVVRDGGNTTANILCIAGGGGGKGGGAAGQAGPANSAGQQRNGLGGFGANCSWNGSAGGGFLTDGTVGAGSFTTGGRGFGFATANQARGGSGGIGPGGFGGGGSGGADSIAGAGAGGGYNGGDGQCDGSTGQGGGSFNNGNNQVNTANANALAGGFVIISKLFAG